MVYLSKCLDIAQLKFKSLEALSKLLYFSSSPVLILMTHTFLGIHLALKLVK